MSDRSTTTDKGLTGAERAALVLRELGEGLAINILRQMDEQAITKISVAMTTLPKLSYDVRQDVISSFAKDFGMSDIGEDGMKFITGVLTSALGETQARAIIEALSKSDRQSPFHKIDPQTLAIPLHPHCSITSPSSAPRRRPTRLSTSTACPCRRAPIR